MSIFDKDDGRRSGRSRSSGWRNEKLRDRENHRREKERRSLRDLTSECGGIWDSRRRKKKRAGSSERGTTTNRKRWRSHLHLREIDGRNRRGGGGFWPRLREIIEGRRQLFLLRF